MEKAPVRILNGGYEKFKLCYPHECINPKYEPVPQADDDDQLLEHIHYPDYESSTSDSSRFGPPKVDRSTKANILSRTLEEKKQDLNVILQKEEETNNKSLQMQKEHITAEQDWNKLSQSKDNETLKKKELELLHRIMELESRQKDVEEENDQLKRDKAELLANARRVSEYEAAELEKQAQKRRVEEQERERRELTEKQKKLRAERLRKQAQEREEQKLKEAREPKVREQEVPMSVPMFDRNSKPMVIDFPEKYRDFSPVRGGMVSKQLLLLLSQSLCLYLLILNIDIMAFHSLVVSGKATNIQKYALHFLKTFNSPKSSRKNFWL